jgi:hypothetical protein
LLSSILQPKVLWVLNLTPGSSLLPLPVYNPQDDAAFWKRLIPDSDRPKQQAEVLQPRAARLARQPRHGGGGEDGDSDFAGSGLDSDGSGGGRRRASAKKGGCGRFLLGRGGDLSVQRWVGQGLWG